MTKPDPANYETLAKPLQSETASRDALTKFLDMVKDARQECGIPEVAVQAAVYVQVDDETKIARASFAMGDSLKTPSLMAFALNNILNGEPE